MAQDTSSLVNQISQQVMQAAKPSASDRNTPKMILSFAAGINQNDTPDIAEASAGFNFELGAHQTSIMPRPAFDLIGTAPNAGSVTGINQMLTRAGVKTTLVTAGANVYNWSGGSNITRNGTTTNGLFTITGLSQTSDLVVGMLVTGTGIGTAPNKIVSIDSSAQVTLSVASTASATVSITFTAFTSVGTVTAPATLRSTYWSLGDYLAITDLSLNNTVKTWDGTNFYEMQTGLNYSVVLSGGTTNGSAVVTMASTTGLTVGMLATGAGIGAAPNPIVSIVPNTSVTLTVNSTATATVPVTFTNLTLQGTTAASSPIITMASTAGLRVGMLVTGTGIGASPAYIVSIVTNVSITMSVNCTANGTVWLTFPSNIAFSAKFSVVFLNRMWYFNVTSGTATPHLIVASKYQDPKTVSVANQGGPTDMGGAGSTIFPTGLEAFFLVTPDLKAVNSVSVFQNLLLISTTDGQIFQLSGVDASTFQFTPYFTGSSSISNESMINIGNDVIYVRKGGNINLLASKNYAGDVKSNDIARWLPTTTANITSSIAAYDQNLQKVYFFINNQVLVLFKNILYESSLDKSESANLSPWSIYTTLHPSNFNTSVAQYIYAPASNNSTLSVYFGDSTGNVYLMSGTGIYGDAGSYAINVSRTTRLIDMTVISPFPWQEKILMGKVQYRRQGNPATLNLSFAWSDELNTSTASIVLKGVPSYWNYRSYWGGGSYWQQQAFVALNAIGHQTFSPTGKGSGIYLTLQCQTTSPFTVDHIELF